MGDLNKTYYQIAQEEAQRLKGEEKEPSSTPAAAASVTDIVRSIIDDGIEPGTDAFYAAIDKAVYGRESDGGPEMEDPNEDVEERENSARMKMMNRRSSVDDGNDVEPDADEDDMRQPSRRSSKGMLPTHY